MSNILSQEQINDFLSKHPGWSKEGDSIKKEFQFKNFTEALAFLVQVGFEAEAHIHHPEIFNVYNKVVLTLSTHDAGNKITDKDSALAAAIDKIEK